MSGRRYADVAGYVIREKIGDGAFAKVHLAVDYETHQTAACKIVPITKSNMDAQALKDLKKEIKVHSQLKHRHILQFIADRTVMDDEESARLLLVPAVYMLLEYASGGDLFDKIVPDVGLSPAVAHHYLRQIISGLDYMHGKGVCHRDLKPENIMLDLNGTLKLCDFGLCAVYKHKGMERLLTERCGSLPYVAPELNGDQPYKGELIDVWGVGVILFTLLVGNTPWDEPTDASPEYAAFISGEIFDVAPWDRVKGETLDFLLCLLNPNPRKRITIAQIRQHPWFNQENNLDATNGQQLAQALSQNMYATGMMDFVQPSHTDPDSMDIEPREPGEPAAVTAMHTSQFTQSLMLFSQTQGGTRYTPELTRFYTESQTPPPFVLSLIVPFLRGNGIKCRQPEITPYRRQGVLVNQSPDSSDMSSPLSSQDDNVVIEMKIGGYDARKQQLRGTIVIEPFDELGSFVVMKLEKGSPISWKRLWKMVILSPDLSPYVRRKIRT